MKICTKCRIERPYSDFHRNAQQKDGFACRCKFCARAQKNEHYAANKERHAKQRAEYYAKNRERILATNSRSRAKHSTAIAEAKRKQYEINKSNPEWIATQARKRIENKDRKREYDRTYRALNAESISIRRKSKTIDPLKRRATLQTYKAKRRHSEANGCSTRELHHWLSSKKLVCGWCMTPCPEDFHVDHINPLAKGGRHEISNLTIACPKCNFAKKAKDPFIFSLELALDEVLAKRYDAV